MKLLFHHSPRNPKERIPIQEQVLYEDLEQTGFVKFAVFEEPIQPPEKRERILYAFDVGNQHVDMVQGYLSYHEGHALVGAGEMGADTSVRWDSTTCRLEYGKDRPKDPAEADTILEEVRETLVAWLETMK